jgi:hypothetical protein
VNPARLTSPGHFGLHPVHHVQPTHADFDLGLVCGIVGLPQGRILFPQPLAEPGRVHVSQRLVHRFLCFAESRRLPVAQHHGGAARFDDRNERVE